tara:strand:+ start:683 stop:2182 length:1500 start_codon:yes stop_codon:yes gene_type:complete
MKTATEKYNAVLEGKADKKEFVRQMRQQFPNFISQFNGFDDSVQILKNKGMIFEVKKEEPKTPEINLPLEVIERGIDIELEAAGIDSVGYVSKEQYLEAKRKSLHNLKSNMNHYLDLMAGESNNVDKNDKMKEVKKGEEIDVPNGMKKADLKENYTEEQILSAIKRIKERKISTPIEEVEEPSLRETVTSAIGAIQSKYENIPGINQIIKEFIKAHAQDIMDGAEPVEGFNNYISTNYEALAETETSINEEDVALTEQVFDIIHAAGQAANDIPGTAMNFMEAIGQEFEIDFEFGRTMQEAEKKANKDYDGDGEIESGQEEYKGSKDKAIKGAMSEAKTSPSKSEDQLKEAVKMIIKKVLKEEVITEAATAQLSRFGEEYADFGGTKQIVNQLENIVTEIESFYDRINGKVRDIFVKMGEVTNEEGLKVGGFIAPALEASFRQDLRPVQKTFLVGIELPRVKTISRSDIDRVSAGGELEEEPKQTIFTPVVESKSKKKK